MRVEVLAAVLLLGNVVFHGDGSEAELLGQAEVDAVAALLGLAPLALYSALLKTTTTVGDQPVSRRLSLVGARAGRDALARALYARMLGAVLRRGNAIRQRPQLPSPPLPASSSDGEGSSLQDSGQIQDFGLDFELILLPSRHRDDGEGGPGRSTLGARTAGAGEWVEQPVRGVVPQPGG